MKKKKKKASSNRLMFFGVISISIIAFFIFTFFSYVIEVKKLNNEQKKIEKEITTLKAKEDNLKNEITKLKDPDYLARYARESYMYSKDGEYIIKVNEEEDKEIVLENNNTKQQFLIGTILTSTLFLGIVITKKAFF